MLFVPLSGCPPAGSAAGQNQAGFRYRQSQLPSGGFSSWGTANCESCAQVIVALTALGLDPQKEQRLIKNDQSVVDALCTFAVNDGFYHSADLAEVNGMATEQAYYALTAYARFLDGQTRLYDMTDCIT